MLNRYLKKKKVNLMDRRDLKKGPKLGPGVQSDHGQSSYRVLT